ncbi:hypothetical protein BDW62DRAFT_189821 [Aspergillus aurantiobrunneus]
MAGDLPFELVALIAQYRRLDPQSSRSGIDISPNLQATLADEYSSEEFPSDGEVYLKVRQYKSEGKARFEGRWMARLSANKAKRFRQLTSRVNVRTAFDRLPIIPALLFQGMKLGSLPRAVATNCYEEMVYGLGSVLEM